MKILDIFKRTPKFKKFDNDKYIWFEWVYECEQLPDSPSDRIILTDTAWKRCFDKGLTPKEAVEEYLKQKVSYITTARFTKQTEEDHG